jgi:hypothetical protein
MYIDTYNGPINARREAGLKSISLAMANMIIQDSIIQTIFKHANLESTNRIIQAILHTGYLLCNIRRLNGPLDNMLFLD